jgi:mRNA-degrading endonuclease toxin of MazEF toxin-antitoxin module
MVDKATTVPRAKIGPPIGRVDEETMQNVDQALRGFLSI